MQDAMSFKFSWRTSPKLLITSDLLKSDAKQKDENAVVKTYSGTRGRTLSKTRAMDDRMGSRLASAAPREVSNIHLTHGSVHVLVDKLT